MSNKRYLTTFMTENREQTDPFKPGETRRFVPLNCCPDLLIPLTQNKMMN